MTKEELKNALLKKDNKFATDYIVVANTYMNISFKELTRKLDLLNAKVNKKLFLSSLLIIFRERSRFLVMTGWFP